MAASFPGNPSRPRLNSGTILAVRAESTNPYYLHDRETKLRQDENLWQELLRGAAAIAGEDLRLRQQVMAYGSGLIELVSRAYEIQAMEDLFPTTPEGADKLALPPNEEQPPTA